MFSQTPKSLLIELKISVIEFLECCEEIIGQPTFISKKRKPFVILTVPHAKCKRDGPYHNCDYTAPTVAACLSKMLDEDHHEVLYANVNRRTCDMNRKYCKMDSSFPMNTGNARSYGFRKDIRNIIKNKGRDSVVVLDIHSFPPIDEKTKHFDIYMIYDNSKTETLGNSLKNYIRNSSNNSNITVGNIPGYNNDIIDEMTELGVRSLLIEFNENLLRRGKNGKYIVTEKLKDICILISNFVKL